MLPFHVKRLRLATALLHDGEAATRTGRLGGPELSAITPGDQLVSVFACRPGEVMLFVGLKCRIVLCVLRLAWGATGVGTASSVDPMHGLKSSI